MLKVLLVLVVLAGAGKALVIAVALGTAANKMGEMIARKGD